MGWLGLGLKAGKIGAKKTKDLTKTDILKKEIKVLAEKEKRKAKLAKDVKENPKLFQEGTAAKKGYGAFGFKNPKGK